MAVNRELPVVLARVSERTGTPIYATVLATSIILVTSVGLTFKSLIVIANLLTLAIFIVVNLALLRVRSTHGVSDGVFAAPVWVPAMGVILSLLMMIAHFL